MTDPGTINLIRVLEIRMRFYGEKGQESIQQTMWVTQELIEDCVAGKHKLIDYCAEQLFDDIWKKVKP